MPSAREADIIDYVAAFVTFRHGDEFVLRALCEKVLRFLSLCARGCWMITKTSLFELST